MNKKNNRKGFTTVELVIVIAVIAILATALIPTFGGLINSANKTAAMQEARQIYNDYLLVNADAAAGATYAIYVDGYYFKVTNGQLNTEALAQTDICTNCTVATGVSGTSLVTVEANDSTLGTATCTSTTTTAGECCGKVSGN